MEAEKVPASLNSFSFPRVPATGCICKLPLESTRADEFCIVPTVSENVAIWLATVVIFNIDKLPELSHLTVPLDPVATAGGKVRV
jgi:hypothetical protein